MSRTPDDLSAPPQTRPPHISPQWWYRATWHARQQAINAHNRTTRPADRTCGTDIDNIVNAARTAEAQPMTPAELDDAALIETIELLLEDGAPIDRIIATTGRKVGALEARMRRAGRLDLSRQLGNIRNAMRRKGCPHCGKSIWSGATQCGTCANKASSAKKREAKVAVLEVMLEADPSLNVEHAAARLGYSSGNGVQQMLRRAERDDLLDVFARNSARAGARVTSKRRERAA